MKRLPFLWRNPIGYLITVAFECMLLLIPVLYMAVLMTSAFAIHVFVIEFTEDAISNMLSLNQYAKTERSQQRQQYLFNTLFKFIRAHSDAKELNSTKFNLSQSYYSFWVSFRLIGKFSELYETVLQAVFAGGIIAMWIAMLMIQIEIVEF